MNKHLNSVIIGLVDSHRKADTDDDLYDNTGVNDDISDVSSANEQSESEIKSESE